MRDIEDLFRKVRPFATSCPEPLMVEHIRDAAITLCERTRCWRFTDTFETVGDEQEIVCTPPYAALWEIEEARFDDRKLERSKIQGDMIMADLGQPQYLTQLAPNSVSLQPRGKGTLWISMFLKPSQNADMLPDILVDEFGTAIGQGALSTLLLLPNEPFSNPQLAMLNLQKFDAALDRNFAYNVRGQQRAPVRTRARYL